MVAGGIGAPPKPPTRQADRSCFAKSACNRHRLYIAGTMIVKLMRSRATRDKNSAALKDGTINSVPPRPRVTIISPTSPVTWLNGTATAPRSSALSDKPCAKCNTECTTLRCVSIAPLGKPVVPDVYMMVASSSGPTSAAGISMPGRLVNWRPASTSALIKWWRRRSRGGPSARCSAGRRRSSTR